MWWRRYHLAHRGAWAQAQISRETMTNVLLRKCKKGQAQHGVKTRHLTELNGHSSDPAHVVLPSRKRRRGRPEEKAQEAAAAATAILKLPLPLPLPQPQAQPLRVENVKNLPTALDRKHRPLLRRLPSTMERKKTLSMRAGNPSELGVSAREHKGERHQLKKRMMMMRKMNGKRMRRRRRRKGKMREKRKRKRRNGRPRWRGERGWLDDDDRSSSSVR